MTPPKTREIEIDAARGLMLALMAQTHIWTAVGMGPGAPGFALLDWIPRGWTSIGFIILAGFTGAKILPWGTNLEKATRTSLRRGVRLLIVLFVTNLLFETIRLILLRGWDPESVARLWRELFSLQGPYGLSIILLPISLLSFLAPVLVFGRQHAAPLVWLGAVVLILASSGVWP